MNKKKLAIVGQCDKLDIRLLAGYEILALSIDSLYKFRKTNQKVYPIYEFCLEANSIDGQVSDADDLSLLFMEVDKELEKFLGFSNAFSANSFWFIHRISSLIALNAILLKIKSQYQSVLIYSDYEPKVVNENVSLFSTRFNSLATNLDFILISLYQGLKDDMSVTSSYSSSPQIFKRKLLFIAGNLKRIDSIIRKRVLYILKKIIRMTKIKKANVFVAQVGYDVDFVKNEFNDINFFGIDSFKKINFYNNSINKNTLKGFNSIIENTFNDFLHKRVSNFKHLIIAMFEAYVKDTLIHLPQAERLIEKRFIALNPKALLFSIGIQSLMGEVLAKIAQKNNTPILTFKHSGAGNFFLTESFLEQFSEYQSRTERYQFIHSSIERKFIKPTSRNIKTINSRPLITPKYLVGKIRKKKILYVMGPPSYFGLKELSKTISDSERLKFLEKLLFTCNQFNIQLDIKIHPIGRENSISLVRMILENESFVNILPPGPVEKFFNHYDCACFDMLASRSLAQAFTTEIDIILFVPPNVKINNSTFGDLYERVMVVRNIESLDNILKSYYVDKIKPHINHKRFKSKYIFGDKPKELINRLALFFYD
ncbi:hypothetical protein N8823_04375 [Candidatus Pseudothioglobus singularis]|nr:hypothetical protein [Candidatus Pseudothioglobus singularis]